MTPLDHAIEAASAAPGDDTAHRALLATLAGTEIFLLLASEPADDTLSPRLFELETGAIALAFDGEERLAEFAGPSPYAAMPGRELVQLLAGQGIGLGVNLGSGHETMLPPEALDWLLEAAADLRTTSAMPVAVHAPADIDVTLLPLLEARLASASGLAKRAVLVQAEHADGQTGPCIFIVDVVDGAEAGIAERIADLVAVMGRDEKGLDLAFVGSETQVAKRVHSVGLVIDLPDPPEPPAMPQALDPTKPPKLR